MAQPKRVPLPAILLANDLLDGDVVFSNGEGWSRDPADALIARDDVTADRLEAHAKAAFDAQLVVDAYLVDVSVDAEGIPTPRHFRERFKTMGPSNRPDLGKQAAYGRAGSPG